MFYYYKEWGEIKWYDIKGRCWRVLKGMKGFDKILFCIVILVDFGGKMVVLWDRDVVFIGGDKMILCVVIVFERCNDEEIWGKVEWSDIVFEVFELCIIKYVFVVIF